MSEQFQNWSGIMRCSPDCIERPADLEGIIRVVRDTAEAGRNLRAAGTAHSFTPLLKTNGTILSLENYQGIEDVDTGNCRATALAGTKLHYLNELLDAQGLAMENLGDINRQAIAGAIGTGTHGTGIRYGNISSQACAITLVTAAGEAVECSEEKDPELFKAAQVSLGALGVVAKVRLRLQAAYNLKYERRRFSFDECAERCAEFAERNRHFEFFWFPHTDVVLAKFLNETDAPEFTGTKRKFITDVVLENVVFGSLCALSAAFPGFAKTSCKICGALMSEGVEVYRAHRVFSTQRMIKFNEMEYAVPADRGIEAMREVMRWVNSCGIPVCFPIEYRLVKGDDIYLSPSYGRDTAYIAIHMYRKMEHRKFFEGIEKIFRAHDGRPHWGKLHTRTAADLAPAYPMWEKFQQVRKKMDPAGLFMNDHLKRILETS